MEMPSNGASISADELGLSRIRQLEARYIELLEKRVSDLEALVSKTNVDKIKALKDDEQQGRNLTSNDRQAKFLSNVNQKGHANGDNELPPPSPSSKPSKILFRDMKYNAEGVETPIEVSEKESAMTDQLTVPKDSPELVWTRRFDQSNKYAYSEVQIASKELQEVFRIEFAGDPRLHFSSEKKNELTLISPFQPLLHNWERMEVLATSDCDSEVWQGLKKQIAGQRALSKSGPPEVNIPKAKDDFTALLNQVRITPESSTALSGLVTAKASGTIHFKELWTLFPPGELVYASNFLKRDQVFIVKESPSTIISKSDSGREKDLRKVWYLHLWSYDWNGETFNRVPIVFEFEEFQGARMIHNLQAHPLQYHFPGEKSESKLMKLKEALVERGKIFRAQCTDTLGAQMFDYDGDSISHGSGFQRLKNKQKEETGTDAYLRFIFGRRRKGGNAATKPSEIRRITGRVMVDFNSYIQHAPNVEVHAPMGDVTFSNRDDECRCGSCMGNEALRKNQRRDLDGWSRKKMFQEEQYLLCPPRVLGYHLDSRTWLELDVEEIRKIEEVSSDEAFKKLQLIPTYKNLIKDLVQSHTSGTGKKPMMVDIVKEKGRGLVILLHGPPGVGKTLTAESVASLAGKPLFAVSPSDIGLDPADVEHNLQSLFLLAARWRAVLLFDEADVFLESRSANNSDLTRNALVSVLLRVLEYYSGILILTTNRVNQFDIAVQSRVNLGIKYDDLDKDQKREIFAQFLEQVESDDIENRDEMIEWLQTDPDAIDYFSSLNGRQVRNVLFSAASLASKDGGVLKLKHIKTMAKSTSRFQDSLKVVMQNARMKSEAGRYGD